MELDPTTEVQVRPVLPPVEKTSLTATLLITKIVLSLFAILSLSQVDVLTGKILSRSGGVPAPWEVQMGMQRSLIEGWLQIADFMLIIGAIVTLGAQIDFWSAGDPRAGRLDMAERTETLAAWANSRRRHDRGLRPESELGSPAAASGSPGWGALERSWDSSKTRPGVSRASYFL